MTRTQAEILRVLRRSAEPLSGRQVADIVDLAPHTAIRRLKELESDGLVCSTKSGRSALWTTTADVAVIDGLDEVTEERIALVVTAVELESMAVRERLVNPRRVRRAGVWFVQGEIPGHGITWTIYLAQAGMGNATSAALVALAADKLNANVVAFVGTAGGLKKTDHQHGDVIVASRIHNPYIGKQVVGEASSELLGRDKTYSVPAPLLNLAFASIADSEWSPSKHAPAYNPRHGHAFVAPIVAVEAVQTDPDGPVVTEIRKRFQDAAALDMESYGLAAGSDIHDLPVLVVRGISDFLGDKTQADNDDIQPEVAANAARFLRHMLSLAHPDDFKRTAGTNSPDEPPLSTATAADGDVEAKLPGGVKVWLNRLRRRSPARAEAALAAIAEMREGGTTAATWLNKAVHRPPAWLREDDTGDGWALMGSLAALASSTVSWRAFDHAANAAALTSDLGAQGCFMVTAALHRITNDDEEPPELAEASHAKALAEIDALPPEVAAAVTPLTEFYRAAIRGELREMRASAEVAISWLGLVDESGVLHAARTNSAPHQFDTELRDVIAATILQQTARAMLTPGAADEVGVASGLSSRSGRGNPVLRDLADDALLLAQWAVRLRPMSEGARLTEAQTLLAVLVSMTGRVRGDFDLAVSKRAKEAELAALEVRAVFREWNAPSGPALAVAGRARSIQGDIVGALRMLLPPPDGIATQAESRHPEVVRLAAFFAMADGRNDLAIDLVSRGAESAEAEFMRAAIYGSVASMSGEAKAALFRALDLATGHRPLQFQALMGLARLYPQLSAAEQSAVDVRIDELEESDEDLADVLRARVALATGDAAGALELVRGLAPTELVLVARTDALVELDRAEEAVRILFDEGLMRRDPQVLLTALDLAVARGMRPMIREVSHSILSGEYSDGTRLRALESLRNVERMDSRWPKVLELTERLMQETRANGLPVPESEQWMLVEALYFEGRFASALEVLEDDELSVAFNQREKVVLFFSVLKRALDEQRASGRSTGVVDLGRDNLFKRFMEAAREWAHDEQLAAFALTLSMTAPDANLSDAQVMAMRKFADDYFVTHGGEGASIQQIKVEDNLDELVEFLSKSDERNRKLAEIAEMVRTNRAPLSVLTAIAGRSYAESLIRLDMAYFIAVEDDGGVGVEAANAALNTRVVVDTSALLVGPLTGVPLRKLLGKFDQVVVPEPLRMDVERARSSLALLSTGTIGWDPRRQQPYVSETPDEEAEAYAAAANELWAQVQVLPTGQARESNRSEDWLSAVNYARHNGLALWADDVALRQVARTSGVSAFGSLDLVSAFLSADEVASAISSMRANRVVDLPIVRAWHALVDEAGWDPSSPFAAAIARPYAWRNVEEAFRQFQAMMKSRDPAMEAQQMAIWTQVAATGLAMATPLTSRPRVVAALLAWVVVEADPFFSAHHMARRALSNVAIPEGSGDLTQMLLQVAEELRDQHFRGANFIEPLVEILGHVLQEAVGPAAASRIVADLSALLKGPFGPDVFAAYLKSAGV